MTHDYRDRHQGPSSDPGHPDDRWSHDDWRSRTHWQWAQWRKPAVHSHLVVGLGIIAIGVILLGHNLGLFEARHVLSKGWSLALVMLGVLVLRSSDHRRGRIWGWSLITAGIWMLANKVGWIDIGPWQLLVPGLLLFIGGTMAWRSVSAPMKAPKSSTPRTDNDAEFVRASALMLSSCELRLISRSFRGAEVTALMGGISLDLGDARMEADAATMDVFVLWGGIEINVPPEWTVVSDVTTLMGGLVDKRRSTSVVPRKKLTVRGVMLMGGISVKN